jgi:polyvinyl alcohol dehydrogenase (cytochrome)
MNKNLATMILAVILAACQHGPSAGKQDAVAATGTAEAPHPGEATYLKYCGECHDKAVYKAPSRMFISMTGARSVLAAMTSGPMVEQASMLSLADRVAIAEFLTGQDPNNLPEEKLPPRCDADHGFDVSSTPVSVGWGVDHGNSRFQPADTGGLSRADVQQLEVKWALAYPNAIKARSQPAYGGGAIYVGGHDGTVRALDARTGCLRWSFRATAEVRTAIVVSPWSADDKDSRPVIYFADLLARAYAVDARTGELIWKIKVDDHPDATVTGTVALAAGRVFVPVSSLEVVSAGNPSYECCTFRGSVVALDATNGEVIWKSYTIPEVPAEAGTTSAGTRILGPSGAPIWNSPTVDLARNRLYVGSGENYSSPADGNSDAIIAFDLDDGEKLWVSQQTQGDAWNIACLIEGIADRSNCPVENGPDYDFGASPILVSLGGGADILVGGQKSGNVMGIDPDNGETLWKKKLGRGGVQGGIHFGMASEGRRVYVPISDMYYLVDDDRYGPDEPARPGLHAIDAETGALHWSTPAPDVCGDLENCDPGISQAITAIPGAVIAGHMDGRMRIYDGETGEQLWELDAVRDFETVSGEIARGGSFSGGGGIAAHGLFYVNSGYGIYNHMAGNVLLAIGPADP